MSRSLRTRPLRATAAAFAIAMASLTTAACGEDVVDDGVEQEIEEEREGGGEEEED